jgi:hypothetical protein
MVRAERSIGDYDATFDSQRQARLQRSGQQAGDPLKAALAIMQVVASPTPPAHLLLGRDAVQFVKEKFATLQAEIQQWETVSQGTDYV